ncbi:zinc metallochaperone AztD [Microbacterium neungamense]|uniref:zinc metallochaperone AztD n=1 Tax=Microbacterium neungamense TaxID=2810535 RepID=UPI00217DC733|nr:zinc metallochaperone AztD [Microbacterium neungamense]
MKMRTRQSTAAGRALRAAAAAGIAAVLLSGCAAPSGAADTDAADTDTDAAAAGDGPRVAIAYEGGVLVVDGETLEVIADLPSEEFVRLNPAGDDRHVVVTTSKGFQFLDMDAAELTDLVVPAEAAAHVVRHAGRTVLYDDATSDTTIFDTAELAEMDGTLPAAEVVPGVEAHHGVSVVLEDGTLVTTVGDATARTGIRATDAEGAEIAANADCPGVHGEGAAKDEALVFGCENGVLVYDDGEITKLTSPDAYGRIGNAYASEDSPLVVMDYNDDPDAEGYLLSDIVLVDTEAKTLQKVALPDGVEYTWRGVVRGPSGDALMIGSDGWLHVIDPATGAVTASHDAIEAWEGPAEWQQPHPAIAVAGDVVYVTDAANREIVALDAAGGEEIARAGLPETPNEIAVVE